MMLRSNRSLKAFVRSSLQILRREHPDAFAALVANLGRGELYLSMDGEAILLRFGLGRVAPGAPRVYDAAAARTGCPVVETSRGAVVRMADGELTIMRAVLAGELEVKASPADLLRLERSLDCYLRGAVRCPSFPALLDDFRRSF